MSPPPPSRRPSQKPAAIRAAAQRLFLQHGLKQTSMDAVAAEAGATKQTVYRYFGSKEGLFVAVLKSLVVERLRPDILAAASTVARSGDEFEDTLLNIATRIVDHVLDPTYIELVRIVVAEAREFPELAELFWTTAIEPMAQALAEMIEVTIPDTDRSTSVPAVLRLFVGPILSYELEAMLGEPVSVRAKARAEIPAVVKLIAAAIRAPSDVSQ